jgi:hypothetical protein
MIYYVKLYEFLPIRATTGGCPYNFPIEIFIVWFIEREEFRLVHRRIAQAGEMMLKGCTLMEKDEKNEKMG